MTKMPDAHSRNVAPCAVLDDVGLLAELARWSACTLAAVLLLGAGTLWCRRAASALQEPLDWPSLVLLGVVSGGVGLAARLLARRSAPVLASGAFEGAVSLGLLAWGSALSLSGSSPGGLASFWAVLAGEEFWAWRRALGRSWLRSRLRTAQDGQGTVVGLHEAPSQDTGAAYCPAPPSDVVQEFVRTQQPDGSERLTGRIRVPVSPGQRTTTVHLAFCPPFGHTPKIVVTQREGPAARLKESQLLPHGARLDVKLAQAAEAPASVLLEIAVRGQASVPFSSLTEVAVAVVRHAECVLVGQRPEGVPLAGFCEFPGGRILPGESPERAAARECREETGLEVRIGLSLGVVEHVYEHGPVRLHFFTAEPLEPEQPPSPPFRWLRVAELASCRFPAANAGIVKDLAAGR